MYTPVTGVEDPAHGLIGKLRALRMALDVAEQDLLRGRERSPPMRPAQPNHQGIDLSAYAAELYNDRALRDRYFDPSLFGEPAWDILLDLYIAHEAQRAISVTSSCIGSRVPVTTGLRWLKELEMAGLVSRSRIKQDGRMRQVALTPLAIERMTDLLLKMATHSRR